MCVAVGVRCALSSWSDPVVSHDKHTGEIECKSCEVSCIVIATVFRASRADETEKGSVLGGEELGFGKCASGMSSIRTVECCECAPSAVIVNDT